MKNKPILNNARLYKECLEFVQQVFRGIKQQEKIKVRDRYLDYKIFFQMNRESLVELESYINCTQLMESDPIISKHLNVGVGLWNRMSRKTAWDYLLFLLTEQLYDNKGDFTFNPEHFKRRYLELETFFYQDIVDMRAFIRLHHFLCEVNEIKLEGDITIRQLDERDFRLFPTRDPRELFSEYIIECDFEDEKKFGSLDADSVRADIWISLQLKLLKVLSALRFYKKGLVQRGSFSTTPKANVIELGVTSLSFHNPNLRFFHPYRLVNHEIEPFKEFWKEFSKINFDKYSEFDMAIRRFQYSYDRYRLEDKLIDLIICLESLLFKKGEKGELTHKLSVRITKLISDDFEGRKEIKKKIRDYYELRSKIIHGEKYEINQAILNTLEDYLRDAMKIYYECLDGLSHNAFIEWLDLS